MQYHTYTTMLDEFRRFYKVRDMSWHQIYHEEVKLLHDFNFTLEITRRQRLMRCSAEYCWILDGRPYYNVHPEMVNILAKTNLDNIPAKLIEVPNPNKSSVSAACFRFSTSIPIRVNTSRGLQALVVSDLLPKEEPIPVRSVLFAHVVATPSLNNLLNQFQIEPVVAGDHCFLLCLDEGMRQVIDDDGQQRMLCNVYKFDVKGDETIPQAIDRTIGEVLTEEQTKISIYRERLEKLFKVIITTGFLANSPEDGLIVPDILNKDEIKYREALAKKNQQAIENIIARARRRGHNGYNVGTNEMFVGEFPPISDTSNDAGNELKWSHLRRGHPHAVRYGVGKEKVKIKWFRPTRVRPDLPFKLEEK